MEALPELLAEIRACHLCPDLPLGPRPVLQASATARILIAAQAPGRKVHASGRPFTDASGERLRDWLGMDSRVFYDEGRVAIVPMGFCYPGTGSAGDLPPRPECAPQWRARVLAQLPQVQLTLVIGQYALAGHGAATAPQPAQQPLAAAEPLVRGRTGAGPARAGGRRVGRDH